MSSKSATVTLPITVRNVARGHWQASYGTVTLPIGTGEGKTAAEAKANLLAYLMGMLECYRVAPVFARDDDGATIVALPIVEGTLAYRITTDDRIGGSTGTHGTPAEYVERVEHFTRIGRA